MKNKLFRRAAVLTAALFSLTCMSVTAYAQSDEPAEETTPPAATETVAKPFTPNGTGTVVDNATDEDGKEFFTITTPSENVFYLVIDRQRTEENVYFLNAVTEKDLLALAEADPEPEVKEPVTQPEPDPEPVAEPEPEPEKDAGFPVGNLLMVAAVLLVGGGAAYYNGRSTVVESADMNGTWYEIGLGANLGLAKNSNLYFDALKTFGGDLRTEWQFNAGLRFTF